MTVGLNARKGRILAGFAFAMAVSASSGAFAQCTGTPSGPGAPIFGGPLLFAAAAGGAASGSFAGALGNMSTAFLSQQGSAFVSAPGDPKPDQEGGGVWVRGVDGEVTNKFTSNSTGAVAFPVPLNLLFNTQVQATCPGSVRETFGGVQVGQDISRLNWGGWNVHIGTTAGYLSSSASDNTGGHSNFEVPFLGTYLVATHGRFFADIMVREEIYTANINDATVGLFNQQVGAHGISVAVSSGYNFALANNWFIEPSAGFIWSRTNVDPFNVSGGAAANGIVATYLTNPIQSEIGRLSLRAGTTITSGNMIWQPFASVSVFHEFAGNVTSSASSIPNGAFFDGVPVSLTGTTSTTRVGTYGQYSLGVAAQVANTGWLGFVRVDYRNGDNINGWTGNAGIRYQFTPEMIAAVMPTKAPVKAIGPVIAPTNWTGFYVGGFFGIGFGKPDIRTGGDPTDFAVANPHVAGALGGGEIGYNYQVNKWVFGVEGDLGAANLHGAGTCGTATGKLVPSGDQLFFSPAFLNCENKVNWMATAAARVGYAWGRTLFYVKGGAAWADDTANVSCIFGPVNGTLGPGNSACLNQANALTNGFSTSGNRSGWLIGYGTEFDLGHNWSAKAEYDYIAFGARTALANDGVSLVRDSGSFSQVKIGVNYRFSGPAAVVAKY
ncbi:MAG: autotransporter outer membrane beta-barrel domain-containing protein [Bradyrhizobium sp.]|uniref:autotransporter domain-containing protein n=1 Tax=Bradyrhizobium sp. TaxID=376 RepID=UPI00121EEA47|nr:autotransporter domain-containing protein [Bradyrhizobium sp.]THD59371.1 MAG: autotransporter outer membrane beta-barrel domain-containing protein [Bradyrhizobium sp.]